MSKQRRVNGWKLTRRFRLSQKPSCRELKSSADDGIKYNPVISGDMCLGNDTSAAPPLWVGAHILRPAGGT